MAQDTDDTFKAPPTLDELPDPPPGETGWPWTEQSDPLPETQPDGAPWPKISVATPSYNQGQFIEETIRSVLLQGYPNLEYIVMDGGSDDETVEILEKYDPWIDCWVSEADEGQTHAINKGLKIASGEWFNWINSDDLLSQGALYEITGNEDGDMVAGSTVNFNDSKQQKITCRNLEWKRMLLMEEPVYHQPSIWVKRKKLLRLGGLRQDLSYCFDYEMIIRYDIKYGSINYIDEILAYFRLHNESKTSSKKILFWYEKVKVWKDMEENEKMKYLKNEIRNLRLSTWERLVWHRYLRRMKQSDVGRAVRVMCILLHVLRAPTQRLSRFTAGAVLRMARSG
jgi:glycosyltransferase involved in cell wall biosynthesis